MSWRWMSFVAVKTADQQGALLMAGTREGLVVDVHS